ncbi:hypothetical protein BCR39DRAFT_472332 [Naematelia encephala]|uniref:TauD/TfdA-like domain-containing protein n=1 Tax=Naematelia encephala TaxID=71784 RepID=A0A1Y2APG5_9TREE|nr:hypothetical protein BCR39DRAFT_472332 [Naematelia encephala]
MKCAIIYADPFSDLQPLISLTATEYRSVTTMVPDVSSVALDLRAIKEEQAKQINNVDTEGMKHPDYYPFVDRSEVFTPPEPFEYHDPGLRADPALPVFHASNVTLERITPKLGTKIIGVQLAELDEAGLDQLALLVSQRGFVVFANGPGFKQSYNYVGIAKQLEIARQHANQPRPPTSTEISIVYQDRLNTVRKEYWAGRNSMVHWHVDQSQEPQPPAYTFFSCLETAPTGGDTLFSNGVEAFERLSPPIQDLLLGLRAVHTSKMQSAKAGKLGRPVRREDLDTLHPLVIEHPVTKKKSLYIGADTTVVSIEGLQKEESQMLLDFLRRHCFYGQDFQARVKWEEGAVVIWDQRTLMHSATMDTEEGERRHFFRIIALGGVPKAASRD